MKLLQWLVPWEPSVTVTVVTVVTAVIFIRGCLKHKLLFKQKLFFLIGVLSLYGVSHTQLDYYAEHEFFVHQLQSLVLHHLGPFLIILACPKAALAAGFPEKGRQWLRRVSEGRAVQGLINGLLHPVVLVIVFTGLIVFWLLPSVHFIAMLDARIYRLMNWSMIINGLIFWGIALDSHSKWSPLSRIIMMLAVVPPQILMGLLIFFAPHELYPIYSLCGRAFPAMNSITDQQLGGLILWMNAAMMSVIGVLIVIQKELR